MLLSLMYHHINSDRFSNSLEVAEEHFRYISEHLTTIFPEEYSPSLFNVRVCLVFDDAYYDFYHFAFPLLTKYNLRALLAVPTKYISESTERDSSLRLGLPHSEMMKEENLQKYSPFCTWEELKEMTDSNLVKVASHGHTHTRLTEIAENDLRDELAQSKLIIESRLRVDCDSFVFPYCACNHDIVRKVSEHYRYSFGAGEIMNYRLRDGFSNRAGADEMKRGNEIFGFRQMLGRYRGALTYEFVKRRIKC